VRSLPLFVALLLVAAAVAACGDGGSASSPPPTPAGLVTALPGLAPADKKQDPVVYRAVQRRVLSVFIADGTTPDELRGMAVRIAEMPEVVAYQYVSKREALERAKRMLERARGSVPPMAGASFPASFDILLRSVADLPIVAARFYDDPLVDNDPGTHNGVLARGGSTLLLPLSSPQ